jgi:hypothetical protein
MPSTLTLLLVLAARAAGPTVVLPAGASASGWDQALRLAGLEVAPSTEGADLVCRAVDGAWEIHAGVGDRMVASVPAPTSQREREDLALLVASLAADLGLGSSPSVPPPPSAPIAPTAAPLAALHPAVAPPSTRSPPLTVEAPAPRVPPSEEPAGAGFSGEATAAPWLASVAPFDASPLASPSSPTDSVSTPPPAVAPPTPAPQVTGSGPPASAEATTAPPDAGLPRDPRPRAWAAIEGGAALRRDLAASGTGAVATGTTLDGRLRLGLRAAVASPRDLLDGEARFSERRLGLSVTLSPPALRIAPDLGLTLENAWRRYTRGADPEVHHTVLVAGFAAGLALREGPWALEPTLRLEADLDRTLLRTVDGDQDLPRLQTGAGIAVIWQAGQKK